MTMAVMENASNLSPTLINTQHGPVECVVFGEGPAIFALHGAMGGYDQSVLLARTIGDAGYKYIAVSRPGYLGTPLSSGKSPEEQADLCAALLDALGIEQAGVMAVSGGGPCAIQFALRHQERCSGAILVSTCSEKINTPIPFRFYLIKGLMRWRFFTEKMRKRALTHPEEAAKRSISDPEMRARLLADPETGPLFRALQLSTFDRMPQRMPGTENDIAITRSTDFPLEQITVPVLVVHGKEDSMVPFDPHATGFLARIPGAELLAVDGGEHVVIFTHREMVRTKVAEFLRGLRREEQTK